MNFIDIFLLIPIVYGAYKGFSRGFLVEIATLLGVFMGIYLAMRYTPRMELFLEKQFHLQTDFNHYIAWGITFIATILVLWFIAWCMTKLVDILALGIINKLLGTFLGMVKYFIMVSIVLLVVNFFNSKFTFIAEKHKKESLLYAPFTQLGNNITNIYKNI